ncbi:nucleotidyltransferase domain-containing protein [Reinekea marinisedimentorum]|uniref:Putative nucleotidyltransferase-like protein n=1 Tax=Reinekea marinisedimentorum TaxID=230495 RepID=A0A4R3HX34_9GAMM|nr:nucleotidyltransferase family protein [Reinekea marinisedimentorum]TCS37163.1 putative nucleotidyltransferase-like protein [Reinekea marinisedimentorum]
MQTKDDTLPILALACWDEEQFKRRVPSNIEGVLQLAFQEETKHWRVLPLIHQNLIKAGLFSQLSPELQSKLKATTQKSVANNLAMKSQLASVLALFKANEVPCILLKGMAFSGWIYDDAYPRGSRDIDMLVKEKDFEKAKSLLQEIMDSYTAPGAGPLIGLYEESFIPKGKSGMAIDLHKSITYPQVFNIDECQLWQRSLEHPNYCSEYVRVLSKEDSIIHQAIHCYRDFDFNRYSLVDFHCLKESHDVIFESVEARAKALGCSKVLSLFLASYSVLEGSVKGGINSQHSKGVDFKLVEWLMKTKRQTRNSFVSRVVQAILLYLLPDNKRGVISLYNRFISRSVKAY